jgi:iron complex transport system ATP-binding protein
LSGFANRPDAPTMILVTHHIEEIDSWINHVMVLKNGRTLSSGLKDEILTTDILSKALDMEMLVKKEGQRYYLRSS